MLKRTKRTRKKRPDGEIFPPAVIPISGFDPKGRREFYGRDDF